MKIFHVTERSYYYDDKESTLINEFYDYDFVKAMVKFRELCVNNIRRGCTPFGGDGISETFFHQSVDCFPEQRRETLFQNVHNCIYAVGIEAVTVPTNFAFDYADENQQTVGRNMPPSADRREGIL